MRMPEIVLEAVGEVHCSFDLLCAILNAHLVKSSGHIIGKFHGPLMLMKPETDIKLAMGTRRDLENHCHSYRMKNYVVINMLKK